MGTFGSLFFNFIMTELEAINRMLAAIGQAPITSVEETNPDVAICKRTLTQVSQEVQSEGWTFNTAYNVEISPRSSDNRIVIRATYPSPGTSYVIQMDLSHNTFYSRDKRSIAKRDGDFIYLYNSTTRSYDWGTQPIEVDTVTYIDDIGELPPAAYNYIVAKASTVISMRTVGDPQQYAVLQQQELYARTQLQEYETTQGDYTYFGHPKGSNYYNSYKPYHTLAR